MRAARAAWAIATATVIAGLAGCASGAGGSSASPKPSAAAYVMPAVGAPGYPAAVYPPPTTGGNPLPACPRGTGLQDFTAASAGVARTIEARYETRSLAADLHDSDRAWWPQIITDWRDHDGPARTQPIPILYAGSLSARYPASLGAPDPEPWIAKACGRLVARDSYIIVNGHARQPGGQGEFVFLKRRGHVLLYFAY